MLIERERKHAAMQANLPPPSNPPQNSRDTEHTFTGAQYSASEVQNTEGRKHLRDRLGFQGGSQTPASARKRGKSPQVFSYGQAINGGLSTTGNINMETANVLRHRKTHGGARTVATIVDNSEADFLNVSTIKTSGCVKNFLAGVNLLLQTYGVLL